MHLHASLLTLFTSFIATTVSQTCYGLDGTKLDNTFAPCKSSTTHSGCCATNRSVGADICLDTGLCMATKDEYMGSIWQNGCTDATGNDKACPKMCPDATTSFDGLTPVQAWNVQMCDYGTYCCRASNDRKNCCNNATAPRITTKNIGTFQLPTQTATTPSPSATATPSALAIASPAELALDTTTSSSSSRQTLCKKERRQTAIVGGAVGGILGSALLAVCAVMFWMHKKEKRQRRLKEHYEEQFSQTSAYRKMLASSSGSIMNGVADEEPRRGKMVPR
ncbi:hypothetical protein P153DRAFT_290642 [Dothidotthia symphoricarpi CBS 119687]|uniref:Mid2 domain-containing protein n=1 Tax=Dothidotthia symphoricarpi CBS 119687 TaxID=1392245 RepID=A0A6A6ACK9_9PLEO|nr:uncharacterized protein P153DRAFT_290642 [Dothidotthia symphoricarpi CBS 119687]KAF2129510.1 hypothetical protein P153DRAFT_290642 [Dothidotthia symphoricarpi CBS 119687]